MAKTLSLMNELRLQYEAACKSPHERADVPGFREIDAQLRQAFRWLEKVIAYLDGLKPVIEHRFDLGHGFVFETPRLKHAFVGVHEQRIAGFPVLEEINISYEIAAARPLTTEIAPGGISLVEEVLGNTGLQYTAQRIEDSAGVVRKCVITVPPSIPAAISFRADYRTGVVRVSLVNVDRFDRVVLEFRATAIDEPLLEDLVRLILGRSDAFLHRAPLVGVHGAPSRVDIEAPPRTA